MNDVVNQVEGTNTPETSECTPELLGKSISFDIGVDGSGNGHYSASVQGIAFVITKNVKAIINRPNGSFDIHVTTSAGTDQTFHGVGTGKEITCALRIKGKTTITIDIHSSVPNTTVNGTLTY